ncbi:MAG: DsrE family protein [Gammaproteobacteria bacterium]
MFKTRVVASSLIATVFIAITAITVASAGNDKLKVVYHVSDVDKVQFALNNIKNHIKGVGGPENVKLALVVHGPALKEFHDIQVTDRVRKLATELQGEGVELNACGNTMRAQAVEIDELIPGFVRVDQGGVVRIAELQAQGYLYIRP